MIKRKGEPQKNTTTKTVQIKVPDDVAGYRMRVYFSINHILTASLFASQSAKIEREYVESKKNDEAAHRAPEEIIETQRAYVIGSIFFSTSFLEAGINELLEYTTDVDSYSRVEQLGTNYIETLSNLSRVVMHKLGISALDKYQLSLIAVGKNTFNPGSAPYQNVALLIDLRNTLIHYKPEWYIAKEDYINFPHKWEKKFHSTGIKQNPLVCPQAPYFPDKLLCHDCAKWAVETSLKFVDDFMSRIGLTPSYEVIRQRINAD